MSQVEARRELITGCVSVAHAIRLSDVDVIAAFKNRDSAGAMKAICKHNARMRRQIERTHKKE